jgi:hypothetical protein
MDPEIYENLEGGYGETALGMYEPGAFESNYEGGDNFLGGLLDESGASFEDHFDGAYEDRMEMFSADGFDGAGSFEDFEGDEFSFGSIFKAVKNVASKVAPLAKRFAPQIGALIGGALGGPAGAALGGKLGNMAKSLEQDESDTEDEINAAPSVGAVDESLSESLADTASRLPAPLAQSMGSAITVTLASRSPVPVKAVLPVLVRASGDIARSLAITPDPRARTLIKVLPTIQKRTIATLTAKARNGRPVTPRTAVRVMRKQAQRVLNNPRALASALANNARKRGRLDRAAIARAERFS